jgi:hypothetical protein
LEPCTLKIGDRTLIESPGGPLEAEYALVDAGNIELQSESPGTIREVGYFTNVADARGRLEAAGVTIGIVEEVAALMRADLGRVYARGTAVRRVLDQLSAYELFEPRTYEAGLRRYVGRWLDLEGLARDLKIPRAGVALEAIFLFAAVAEARPEARIALTTSGYTRERRPGERTYRRVALDHVVEIPGALRALAEGQVPLAPDRTSGPSRTDLLAAITARSSTIAAPEARARLDDLARSLMARGMPGRGPLGDRELWALEEQLAHGTATGVIERVDTIERARGRLPGTMYLRAKASLMLGLERPQVIAERVSALSSTMNSFFELDLLAGEAWLAAGDTRKAKAFARDLVENPNAPDELRIRALEILESKSASKLEAAPQTTPFVQALKVGPAPIVPLPPVTTPTLPEESDWEANGPDTAIDPSPVLGVSSRRIDSSPRPAVEDPTLRDRIPVPLSRPPPAPRPHATTVPLPRQQSAPPPAPVPPMATPHLEQLQSYPPSSSPQVVHAIAVPLEAADEARYKAATERPPTAPPPPMAMPPFMRGASLPPYESSPPPENDPAIPRAALVPRRSRREPPELAETLSIPMGVIGEPAPAGRLPTNVHEARVTFTMWSRELGKKMRERHGTDLRTDVISIETMQRFIHERFPRGRVETDADRQSAALFGALLSEILARRLGAQWVDIGPTELGYWAMVIAPTTRVHPFGRVLRFIHMGHRERDLVSYYLELETRQRQG